jgi:hypothetical protein
MIHQRILGFLDGTLSHEEEAELLHTLSVSPEKRDLLRNYLNQASLFARDKQTITVPYKAEQMLWQRMATVLPPVTAAVPAAVEEIAVPVVRNVSFFSRAFNSTSTAIAAATLIVGLGVGYMLGTGPSETHIANRVTLSPATSGLAPLASVQSPAVSARPEIRYITRYIRVPVAASAATETGSSVASFNLAAQPASDLGLGSHATFIDAVADRVAMAQADRDRVQPVSGRVLLTPALYAVGGDDGIKPYLHEHRGAGEAPKTLLQRFEFGVMENFGREYPNSTATNTSMPIITNSAVSTLFQLSPNSTKYWAGASFGTANITKKSLFTRAGNPLDRLQDVLVSDTIHSQSTYIAALLQYRVPAFVGDMTFSAGYGLATLGQMIFGEIGMHYDISREVGLQFALRGMQFHYSLAAERDAAVNSGSGSLVIPKGVEEASPSFNLELGTGLYFHF